MTKLKYFLFILIISALHYSSVSYTSDIDVESNSTDSQCLRKYQAFLGKNKFSSVSTNKGVEDIRAHFLQEYPECKELQQSEVAGEPMSEDEFVEFFEYIKELRQSGVIGEPMSEDEFVEFFEYIKELQQSGVIGEPMSEGESVEYIKEINKDNGNTSALSKALESFESYAHQYYERLSKEPLVSSDLLNCFVEEEHEYCKYSPITGFILNTASLATMGYVFHKYHNPEFYPSSGFVTFTFVSTLLSGAWWSNNNLKMLMPGVIGYRAWLLNSGDYYHLQSSEKIQTIIYMSFLVNHLVNVTTQDLMYWNYLAHTHIDKCLAALGMLAFYLYRIRTPEEHVLFLGGEPGSCAITAFAALGPAFFNALFDAFNHGQNQALNYELSEKAHLVLLYGGAVLFSMISTDVFKGEFIASLMIMTAYISRSFYDLGQPVMEPGEDFNPAVHFLIDTLLLLYMMFQ